MESLKKRKKATGPGREFNWQKGMSPIESATAAITGKESKRNSIRLRRKNAELLAAAGPHILAYSIERALGGNDQILLKLIDKMLATPKSVSMEVGIDATLNMGIRRQFEKILSQNNDPTIADKIIAGSITDEIVEEIEDED